MCPLKNNAVIVSNCRSHLDGGGYNIKCMEPGEIVHIDISDWSWECSAENTENCPGLGGFKVGCENGANITPPPLTCTDADFTANPFGECGGCEGQIFVNEDCSESFYCTEYTPDGTSEGCHLVCPEGKRVYLNVAARKWECIDLEPDNEFICPGKFAVS